MRWLINRLRRLWYARERYPRVRVCPVSGCDSELRRDHDVCTYHAFLCPPPLFDALVESKRKYGKDSRAYRAAFSASLRAIERQLKPPETKDQK